MAIMTAAIIIRAAAFIVPRFVVVTMMFIVLLIFVIILVVIPDLGKVIRTELIDCTFGEIGAAKAAEITNDDRMVAGKTDLITGLLLDALD